MPRWSTYYLRCWIVEQSIRFVFDIHTFLSKSYFTFESASGKGIFSMHPSLTVLYYRLLGAKIGANVSIDSKAKLGEYDLLTIHDGCRIDRSHIRPFCVEREGFFRLQGITLGRCVVINTYTTIAPGACIPDSAVYGPHASSHDQPTPKSYAAYNHTLCPKLHWLLQLLVSGPIITLVLAISCKSRPFSKMTLY